MYAEYTAASAMIVRGLTYVTQASFKLPDRWVPFLSLLLGLGSGVGLYYVHLKDDPEGDKVVRAAIEGLLAGFASLGIDPAARALRGGAAPIRP